MMNVGKSTVGRTAASLGRVVSSRSALSTRSAIGVNQAATRLATAKIPLRQLPAVQVVPKAFLSAGAITEDMKSVMKATENWRDTVTSNTDDAPKKTAALYAPDAVFWGTVSEQVRYTPQHVYEYFDYFARTPKLAMIRLNPGTVRVHGDIAIQAGDYTFAWEGADGPVEVDARFTFHFRREASGWMIVEHHSSAMPKAPDALKAA